MEVSALRYSGGIGLHGRSPLLRLQSDERLILLIRRGNSSAFEVLVSRYHSRLLAFCRHLLGSKEDAEDVLQEVFAAAFNAILADERAINVRPWLYRIARNRSLNHLRRIQAIGVDSMDIHFSEYGATTADKVHDREQFQLLVRDIQSLPETQRTALVLREMDALSYEQIAEAMDTTIPGVKSLLVRARISLAEAAEARQLSCDEVRIELAEVAEGLRKRPAALVRRHLRACNRCATFQTELKQTNKVLAALLPIGPMAMLRQLLVAHTAGTGSGAASGAAGAGGAAGGASAGGLAAGPAAAGSGAAFGSAGSMVSAGAGALAGKAAAGLAAAALVTAGAVEVSHVVPQRPRSTVATAGRGAASRNTGLTTPSTLHGGGSHQPGSTPPAPPAGSLSASAANASPQAASAAQSTGNPIHPAGDSSPQTAAGQAQGGATDTQMQTDPTVLTAPSGSGGQSTDTTGTAGSGTCGADSGTAASGSGKDASGTSGSGSGSGGSCSTGGSQPTTTTTPGACDDSSTTTSSSTASGSSSSTSQSSPSSGGAAPCTASSAPTGGP